MKFTIYIYITYNISCYDGLSKTVESMTEKSITTCLVLGIYCLQEQKTKQKYNLDNISKRYD